MSNAASTPELHATILRPGDHNWPTQLDVMGDEAPEQLWVYGHAPLSILDGFTVYLTGSRASSAYGDRVANDLASQLVDREVTTIARNTYGIGTAVTRAALANDATAHVVVGFGVPSIDAYPRATTDLMREVLNAGGLYVSPFRPDVAPTRAGFAAADRVCAALADRTVVIETSANGAGMRAAHAAHEFGRRTYAIPGPISSVTSWGCNELIRTGSARLATHAEHIITTD